MTSDILVLSVVSCIGLAVGSFRIKGLKLGSAGVLFAGIAASALGVKVDHAVLEFLRDFGLVLFVFMMGLQLGPGFFDSLRREGLRLNAVAVGVVVLGSLASLAVWKSLSVSPAVAAGLLSGATTNTPSLAAAQQALAGVSPSAASGAGPGSTAAAAYALAYPIGVLGIVGSLALLRVLLRIDVDAEVEALERARRVASEHLERRAIRMSNRNLDGLRIEELPHIAAFGVRLSRHRAVNTGQVATARAGTVLHEGDTLLAVGTASELDAFTRLIGEACEDDLSAASGSVVLRRVVVTRPRITGRALGDLHLGRRFGVQVTRVLRGAGGGDLELLPVPGLRVRLGDTLLLVGDEEATTAAAKELGDSIKALNATHFAAIFLGVALGLLAGSVPLALPGLPAPVRLGLAGGPLVVAILAGRFARIGPVVWHVPASASLALRELGMILFLACVGLKAGPAFVQAITSPAGAAWSAGAVAIALAGPLVGGLLARWFLKLDFPTLCGVLAGSTTDPPALAFAGQMTRSEHPAVAYATVYPLAMLLRITIAQGMVLMLS